MYLLVIYMSFFGKMTIQIICSFFKMGLWFFIHFLANELHVVVQLLSHAWLFCNPIDCSPPGSSVWGYWNGLPFSSPVDLPDPGIKLTSPMSPGLSGRFFTAEPPGKSYISSLYILDNQLLIRYTSNKYFLLFSRFPSHLLTVSLCGREAFFFFFFWCSPSHLFFLVFFGVKSKKIIKT